MIINGTDFVIINSYRCDTLECRQTPVLDDLPNTYMKRFALRMMQFCGVFWFARKLTAKRARILMYHNFRDPSDADTDAVSTVMLREQFEYLSRHFKVVPLSRLAERLRAGEPLGNRTLALTIDDGRHNFYEFLFPLLKEFKIPATFFVVSSFIRGQDWIWTDKVLWLSKKPMAPKDLGPQNIDEYFRGLNRMRPESRRATIEALAQSMNVSFPKEPPSEYAPCTWNELREMIDSGLVEIGSHTASHPILSSLSDEESWRELSASRAEIGEGTGVEVVSFCFPNGKSEDYRLSHLDQLKAAGYTSAVVTQSGLADFASNVYELPRIGVSGRTDLVDFAKQLDGVEHFQEKIRASVSALAKSKD
jgi:peptidoglycan/xylan/chitin deacetylase (PgdA/CDA1 family)